MVTWTTHFKWKNGRWIQVQNFLFLNLVGTFPSPTEAHVPNPHIFRGTSEYHLTLTSVTVLAWHCEKVHNSVCFRAELAHNVSGPQLLLVPGLVVSTDSRSLCHRRPLGFLPMQRIPGGRCCLEMHVIPFAFLFTLMMSGLFFIVNQGIFCSYCSSRIKKYKQCLLPIGVLPQQAGYELKIQRA